MEIQRLAVRDVLTLGIVTVYRTLRALMGSSKGNRIGTATSEVLFTAALPLETEPKSWDVKAHGKLSKRIESRSPTSYCLQGR